MPVNFKNPAHYTEVADRPTRKTQFGTVANEVKAAGDAPASSQRVIGVMPHYGIKAVKPKKSI